MERPQGPENTVTVVKSQVLPVATVETVTTFPYFPRDPNPWHLVRVHSRGNVELPDRFQGRYGRSMFNSREEAEAGHQEVVALLRKKHRLFEGRVRARDRRVSHGTIFVATHVGHEGFCDDNDYRQIVQTRAFPSEWDARAFLAKFEYADNETILRVCISSSGEILQQKIKL